MGNKNIYRVTDVVFSRGGYGHDTLTWNYGGKPYWAEGEFFIDRAGYLHHTFSTPTGKDMEIRTKVR